MSRSNEVIFKEFALKWTLKSKDIEKIVSFIKRQQSLSDLTLIVDHMYAFVLVGRTSDNSRY